MSQHYLLPCSCGQKVRVANAEAGGQVTCACGKSLRVPTLRGLRQLEIAPPETTSKAAPGWSPVHGVIFAAGLLVAAVGLGLVAYYGLRYAQIDQRYTHDYTDAFVQAEQTRIDKLTPIEALTEWTEVLTDGLGERQPPPWIAAKQLVAGYLSWIRTGGIALVAGALLAAATLFVGRR
ncbi:MAG TPA: hypothetical protein VKH44_12695 [Pirellulaceae bacterium]|nr:hypothetical protein [Pirellulaceae bacterium]